MPKPKLTAVAVLISVLTAYSQNYVFQGQIGNFKNASSFCVTTTGFFYVTDKASDEVFKLDTLGNKLKDTGGYGWTESTFDQPVDVFATPLNVYVSDKNNNRIQRFDKNLNFISQLHTRDDPNTDERFGFPLSCVTSNQGDMYILDSENKRIIKFNTFGQFAQDFGGFDAGAYSLSDPKKLAVSPDNDIYVLDDKKLIIFDQYGNGLKIISLNENFSDINIIRNNLTLTSDSLIYYSNFNNPDVQLSKLVLVASPGNGFVSSLIFLNKLYVLTKNEIWIYTRS
jgi:DNA-binding beta-propeller fold protein YncE